MSVDLEEINSLPEEDLESFLSEFSQEELYAIQMMVESKQSADLKNLEDSLYRCKCPTPDEFLNEWLDTEIRDSIFPHVRESFNEIWNYEKKYNDVVLYGGTRCFGKGTPVLMYDGSIKLVEEIRVGDVLMGDDSTPRNVLILERGEGELYKVNQNRAMDYVVNENHILSLQYTVLFNKYGRKHTVSEKKIDVPLKEYLNFSKTRKHKLKGYKEEVKFSLKDIDVDPYLLGIWLADGTSSKSSFTTADSEVVGYLYDAARKEGNTITVDEKDPKSKAKTYSIVRSKGSKGSVFFQYLKKNNLILNKHIPDNIKYNSRDIRLKVLAGILDGDGYVNAGCYDLVLKSEKLIKDVEFICHSLGYRCHISKTIKTIKSISFKGEYFRMSISGDFSDLPVIVERRKIVKKGRVEKKRTGIKVTPLGRGEYYGFELDGNGRFLSSDCTVLHNTGKSVLSRLSVVYCIVFLWCLKNPHKFFGLSQMSALAIFLLCFSKKKALSLILDPIFTILRRSPKFCQVKLLESMAPMQAKLGNTKIVWTTASKSGEAAFTNNIQIHLGSSPLDIIGADIVFAVVSEINFFIESVGVSEDDVWGVYIDLKDRIRGTIGSKYGSMLFLDSSANNRDSIIERYILDDACKQPNTFYLNLSRWSAVPRLYPKWAETGETFKVFVGDAQREACIVDDGFGYRTTDETKFIDVPIDAYDSFKEDIVKAIRNQAGLPQGAANRFFPDLEVLDPMWDSYIDCITRPLEAPMKSNPKHLIFDLVKDTIFTLSGSNKYKFKRAPNAPRWGRLDLSEISDRVGLGLIHPEINNNGEILAISDLLVDFRPSKVGFNLESALQFFIELKREFGVHLFGVSSDRYQSSFIKQGLLRGEIDYRLISVDTDKAAYLVLKSKILNQHVRVGYYANILNNFRSLLDYGTKIDHSTGGTSKGKESDKEYGIHSKDLTDVLAGEVLHMFSELNSVEVSYNYDDINSKLMFKKQSTAREDISDLDRKEMLQKIIENIQATKNKYQRAALLS